MRTKDIKLAELKFYNKEEGGVELTPVQSYGWLVKLGDGYLNVLNPYEEFPVLERVPYSNCSQYGLEYGTKMRPLTECSESGPCWIIGKDSLADFTSLEEVNRQELEDIVLSSSLFFKDRYPIVKKRLLKFRDITRYYSLFWDDLMDIHFMQMFFEARCGKKVNVKKDW